jgi:hypothetical protein
MEDQKNTKIDFEFMTDSELDRRKRLADVKNSLDADLTPTEKFIKKRIVPIFLPFMTILITVSFFFVGKYDSRKDKALERYKSEVDLVGLVWDEIVKKPIETKPPVAQTDSAYVKAVNFLAEMYKANAEIYKKDSCYLGIGVKQRPINLLAKVDRELQKQLNNINATIAVSEVKETAEITKAADTSKPPTSVTHKKPKTSELVNEAAKKTGAYKLYIQYNKSDAAEKVKEIAQKLTGDFVVAPLDPVKNSTGFYNEVRYYNSADYKLAVSLAGRLKQITGFDFQLRNIEQTDIKNTLEIWYEGQSEQVLTEIPTPKIDVAKNKVIYEGNRFAAKRYLNVITDDVTIYVDDYEDNKATFRINGGDKIIVPKGETVTSKLNNYYVKINVIDYRKEGTLRNVVVYRIVIEEK